MNKLIFIRFFCLGLLLSWGWQGNTQNLEEDLTKGYEWIGSADSYDGKINVKAYERSGHTTPVYSTIVSIKKAGHQYHYTMDQTEVLINEQCMVTVLHDEKEVRYMARKETEDHSIKMDDDWLKNLQLDQFKDDPSKASVKFMGSSNGMKHYQVTYTGHYLSKADIYLDNQTLFFKKLVYHYDPDFESSAEKTVITFERSQTNVTFSPQTFSESKYVLSSQSKLTLTPKFKAYDLTTR